VGNIPKVKSFVKQPWESMVPYEDLEDQLETGETIVIGSSSVTVVDSNGDDASATVFSGSPYVADVYKLCQRVVDGTDGETYTITFKAVTSLNNKWEVDCKMKVVELP